MRELVKNRKYLSFIGTYLCVCLCMLCTTFHVNIGGIFFKIAAVTLLCLFLFSGNKKHVMDFEKVVLILFIVLFSVFMLIRGKLQEKYFVINILCIVSMLIAISIYFVQNHKRIILKKWFVQNWSILLVCLVFVLLSVEVIDSWLIWDARQYFECWNNSGDIQGISESFHADSGVYDLFLMGHVSLGYSLWMILFQLFSKGSASAQVADIVLAVLSIFAYYQILRKLIGEKYSNNVIAVAVVPYAFSPFVLGLVGNINLDSATMYFALVFIACSLYHYECLELLFATCFCFTKEPAVLYYIGYVVAKIICEYVEENPFRVPSLLRFGFSNVKSYIYALPVFWWVIMYLLAPGGGWESSGIGFFGFDYDLIVTKLKQMFLLNFNYLLWGSIALGISAICMKKIKVKKQLWIEIVPICAMGVVIVFFGCVYVTYVLPRYIVPLIPIMYLVATVFIANMKKIFMRWNIVLAAALLIQSFYVIDPVMWCVFSSMSLGTAKVYGMGLHNAMEFNDYMVYNRQYMYWSETLSEILKESGYNGNMVIVVGNRYKTFGDNGGTLWNSRLQKFEYASAENIESPEQYVVEVCNDFDVINTWWGNYQARYDQILYIIPHWSSVNADFVLDEMIPKQVLKSGVVEHKGYSAEYMILNLDVDESHYYVVSPKNENNVSLYTDGKNLVLQESDKFINLLQNEGVYGFQFIFDEYQVALDVPGEVVDEAGTVAVWEPNDSGAQIWRLQKEGEYYMICFWEYALTYDLESGAISLSEKKGEDNQLWSFSQAFGK